jgi:hypothetical protein
VGVGVDYVRDSRTQCLLWMERRVRDELAAFLVDREQWPTMAEFDACGRMGLRRAVICFGGMYRWAEHFGLPIGNFQGPHRVWTDERIAASLRELIGGHDQWPRRREFSAAGLQRRWSRRRREPPPDHPGHRRPDECACPRYAGAARQASAARARKEELAASRKQTVGVRARSPGSACRARQHLQLGQRLVVRRDDTAQALDDLEAIVHALTGD